MWVVRNLGFTIRFMLFLNHVDCPQYLPKETELEYLIYGFFDQKIMV